MIFDDWFHKEYEPADLQIKQYAEKKEGLHIPATVYLEDLKKAFEAGQKDKEAQIEKMKRCDNMCKNYNWQGCIFSSAKKTICHENKLCFFELKEEEND